MFSLKKNIIFCLDQKHYQDNKLFDRVIEKNDNCRDIKIVRSYHYHIVIMVISTSCEAKPGFIIITAQHY